MNKRFKPLKLLPVWAAVSAALIIAGIVIFALFGFNYSAENPRTKSIAVDYNFAVTQAEREDELIAACEEVLNEQKLSYVKHAPVDKLENFTETGGKELKFTFADSVSREALDGACAALQAKLNEFKGNDQIMTVNVAVHEIQPETFGDAAWRGAIAVGVGAVVALVYLAVRFGIGSALTGLVACVNDVFVTLALLAVTRLPLYAASPLLFAAIAAFCSLLLWMVQCAKMRENFKDPVYSSLSSFEAVEESYKTSLKAVLITGGCIALAFLVVGAVASAGLRLMVLPALIPVAIALYSSLLLAPALHVYVKGAFDKAKAKRTRKYTGKKKADKIAE